MHELVKDYYGKQLAGTADLKTSACCDASGVPGWLKPLLARIHPEVLERSPAKLMVHLTREQVLGFAGQAELLASSSRPVCRLCELPMDPQGHVCPRLN